MENKNNRNLQQDIGIAEIRKDISFLKEEIVGIKKQVFNHIPSIINNLSSDFQKYKLSNARWLIGILVTLLFVLVGMVVNLLK